ncbi:MAG: putative protein N(5)-glutamine methyltransferase, partial [Candidatus Dormibacteria bacterium]
MTALTRADRAELLRQLVEAGCVSARDEARQLVAAAGGEKERLRPLVRRRVGGEPLAWVTGGTVFCGLRIAVHPGVFVPRWHSEPLARRAARLLPHGGRALDIGTGCGAIAGVLRHRRPGASVLASDSDPEAVRCAR